MFKQVSLMKRHPDLTREEFMHLYETHHAKFGEVLFTKARRFVRRYVEPAVNPLTGQRTEPDFDAIMEIWWDSTADYEEAMASISSSGLVDDIRRSGAQLFAPGDIAAFSVVEYDSLLGAQIT